ncbi:MAG: RidA family protein [Candidatus Hodarchaeales archaeon]
MKKTIKIGNVVGPYSPGIVSSGSKMIFVSGQLAADLTADIRTQTKQIMDKIQKILSEAGASMNDIVKTTIFLTDMGNFSTVNEEYAKYFQKDPPARATVQVAGLPLNAEIEIEAIAVKD